MLSQRFKDNFGRLGYSEYDDLEEHEQKLLRGFNTFVNGYTDFLGVLGLATLPCMLLFVSHWGWFQWGLVLWSLDEILSYINHQYNLPVISRRPRSKVSLEVRSKYAKSLLENFGDPAATAKELIGNWVVGSDKLTESHLVKWILLLVFEKPADQLTEAELPIAQQVVQSYRAKFDLPKAHDGQPIRVISPGIEPGKIHRKPAILYRYFQLLRFGFGKYLGLRGFRYNLLSGSKHSFWVRFGNSRETPLVFVVGLGVGFMAYPVFITRLIEAYPSRTIVLLEVPYVSCYDAAPIANMEDALVDIDNMFGSLGIGPSSWMSHSYGSILLTWVVNNRPHLAKRATFVDPINFRLWDASLIRLIFHDPPTSHAKTFLQNYFIPEPNITHSLTTHSSWISNMIFPESLTMPTNIFLSDYEVIFDVKGCKAYLDSRLKANKQKNVIVTSMDATHGGFQFQDKYVNMVIATL